MSIWVVLDLLTNSRTREISAFITTECGSPGIRKSMFTSLSIVCSWLDSSQFTTGWRVPSRLVASPTLTVMLSCKERVSDHLAHYLCVSTTGCPVLSCATSTLWLLLSSDERVWVLPVSTTGCHVLSFLTASSWKERVSISWEWDIFFHLARDLRHSKQRVARFYRF